MTDQEIKVAVAEACGWTSCHISGGGAGGCIERPGRVRGTPPGRNYTVDVPDYTGCLNAMHAAEEMLRSTSPEKWRNYWEFLVAECEPSREYWRATARQRAKALLRALGKTIS